MISPEALDEMDRIVRETCVDPNLTGADNRKAWAMRITPDRVRALISVARGSGVPEGWVLVPIEPTEAMLTAGNRASLSTAVLLDDTRFSCEAATFRAMIAAAPSPVSVLLMGGSDQGLSLSRDLSPTTSAAPLASELAGQQRGGTQ